MTDAAPRRSFGSDNHAGTHPAVLRAIVEANAGDAMAYGADPWTERALGEIRRLSGAEGEAYLVLTGSGANVLGLGLLLGRHEAVICADTAHINTDECGSPERILGTKLLTVPAPDGKLTPSLIAGRLAGRGDEHHAQPGVVAITQTTELGTCYSLAELRAIREFCAAHRLRVFMDGARLANAAAHLGCSLAELAAQADVLSFGGTKNGAMGVEAVIVMQPADAVNAPFLRKQHMQLSSKMRYLGAQFGALLADGLWLRNAGQANAMAARLAGGLADIPGVEVVYPVQSDAVFARLEPAHIAALQRDWSFYVWDETASVVRWMTAFDTAESDVDAFLSDVSSVAGGARVLAGHGPRASVSRETDGGWAPCFT
jgi:threonine aldolase